MYDKHNVLSTANHKIFIKQMSHYSLITQSPKVANHSALGIG